MKREGRGDRETMWTKNGIMQEMIKQQIQNQVKFKYMQVDSWYSSAGL
jgi:SRSO17 transposase